MKTHTITRCLAALKLLPETSQKPLLAIAIFGFVIPNGFFLFYSVVAPDVIHAALCNPVALVFIFEAFLLMFLFAWLIRHLGFRSPGWIAFIIMSLLGSMVFSIPAFLFLANRKAHKTLPGSLAR